MSPARGTALLGGALVLAALLFAMAPLYVPGLALAALGSGAAAWVRVAARKARIEQSSLPASVVEGAEVALEVRATLGRRPTPGGELRGPGARRTLRLGQRGDVELRCELSLQRRGPRRLGPPTLTIVDPLGLARVELTGKSSDVLVLPGIEPLRAGSVASVAEATGRAAISAAPKTEIYGLRPYRPGAPASRIHWPTVARVGTLVERHMLADLDAWPLVVLDAHAPDDEQALDMAVRAAASICFALARDGGCRLMLPGDRRPTAVDPGLRSWPPLHAALAKVKASPHRRSIPPTGGAVLLLVCARSARPVAGALARGSARSIVVTPGEDVEAETLFTVAGCSARRLSGSHLVPARERAA